MANHKLILEGDFQEEFSLIAIHCSEEPYKMAYMLNKRMSLRLSRTKLDVDFSSQGLDISFPLFEYEDELSYIIYNLVSNKNKSLTAKFQSSGGLFSDVSSEKTITTFLLKEFKNVDYFLKIQSDYEKVSTRKLISTINEIEQVISAYTIESEKIKSKNNLIFN
ncbi:MAG: IPExxxVDY family protein [Flavobacteriaceae bacterium]|nr:IPExxxVDY family protein [Flavobacteriaceae bacterium]